MVMEPETVVSGTVVVLVVDVLVIEVTEVVVLVSLVIVVELTLVDVFDPVDVTVPVVSVSVVSVCVSWVDSVDVSLRVETVDVAVEVLDRVRVLDCVVE
jgi:hypothetical protein